MTRGIGRHTADPHVVLCGEGLASGSLLQEAEKPWPREREKAWMSVQVNTNLTKFENLVLFFYNVSDGYAKIPIVFI